MTRTPQMKRHTELSNKIKLESERDNELREEAISKLFSNKLKWKSIKHRLSDSLDKDEADSGKSLE